MAFNTVLALITVFGALAPSQVREAATDVSSRYRFQSELPGSPELVDESVSFSPSAPREVPVSTSFMASIGTVLAVAGLIVVLLLVVSMVAQYFNQRAPPPEADVTAATPEEGDDEASAPLLGDAEALARAGRFAEAIHVLLLRSIRSLVERADWDAPRASTSRELLRAAPVRGRPHEAFRLLVEAVELTRWGERPANRAAYERCQQAYQAIQGPTGGVA